jgi:membrane protein implicated in regulation of membrane protease activity
MMKRIIGITLLASTALIQTAYAQDKAKPAADPSIEGTVVAGKGKDTVGVADVVVSRATITQVDQTNRTVTVKRPAGDEVVIKVSDRVKNFAQVKVGDQIVLRQGQALVLQLKKVGTSSGIRERTDKEGAVLAKPGEKPGIAVAREIQVMADVTKVDKKASTVTLRGVHESRTLKVNDPKLLAEIKKGDQVEVTYVEGEALSVEAAPPAKK